MDRRFGFSIIRNTASTTKNTPAIKTGWHRLRNYNGTPAAAYRGLVGASGEAGRFSVRRGDAFATRRCEETTDQMRGK